jgi:hypothetical protein
MNNKDLFSLDNFKKWMKNQEDFAHNLKNPLIGEQVMSKISCKKLESVITLEDGYLDKVIKDFYKNGGKIKDVINKEYLVEVDSGTFLVSKNYVFLD